MKFLRVTRQSPILYLFLLVVNLPLISMALEDHVPLPTVWLIGDSTVNCGRGDGQDGMWGWGQVIAPFFDTSRCKVNNRAIGGRSSRSFLTEGRWDEVRDALRPGDYVLIQFGHNDGGDMFKGSRPRASLKGNGDETKEGIVESTGKSEVVHSYGWYLRHYIQETQSKGATAIVLSQVPRNMWRDGKVLRASQDYGQWAKESAEQAHARFIDLNERVALVYETYDEPYVTREFFTPKDHTHTSKPGAEQNARCVIEGIRSLDDEPIKSWLADSNNDP